MTIPNLAGVISKEDVFRKGTGSYAANYVSWARIANYIHTKAPGWEFALRPAPEGGHIWKAPDGTGYIVSYFKGPEDQVTSDFVFPCQDNRNLPIPFEKVSCRTLTDTHRRALCANAAFAFSLGYELWAKEEVEAVEPAPEPAPKKTATKKAAPKAEPKAAPSTDAPLSKDEKDVVIALMKGLDKDKLSQVVTAFKAEYNLDTPTIAGHIQTQQHVDFINKIVSTIS